MSVEEQQRQFETLKLLHEHTYKRIMWFRDEIWRITLPVWKGFGAFLVALLAAFITLYVKSDKQLDSQVVWLFFWGTLICSVVINYTHYWYISKLQNSIKELNLLMEHREFALSKIGQTLNNFEGFHRCNMNIAHTKTVLLQIYSL